MACQSNFRIQIIFQHFTFYSFKCMSKYNTKKMSSIILGNLDKIQYQHSVVFHMEVRLPALKHGLCIVSLPTLDCDSQFCVSEMLFKQVES